MKRYRTIVADPPWPVDWHGGGLGRHHTRPSLGYTTMTLEAIQRLPITDLAADTAALFLWVTASLNRQGVGFRMASAWGFDVVGEFVWEKGMRIAGGFPRVCHEIVLVCSRGGHKFSAPTLTHSVQRWRSGNRHSQKPEAFLDIVEQVSPGPRLELFARTQRLGWDTWGNEALNHVTL